MKAAGRAVVLTEPAERRAQLLRPAHAERGQRLGQGEPRAYAAGEVVHRLGPELAQLDGPLQPASAYESERQQRCEDAERERDDRHP